MGSGLPAPAASDPRSSDLSEVDVVEDVEADPERGQAVWQHRQEAEEEHLKTGKVEVMLST